MKRAFGIVVSVTLLAAGLTWVVNQVSYDVSAQGKGHANDVVVIVCETGLYPPAITVLASSNSGGTPAISNGSECAEALASLLSAGFQVRDVASIYGLRVQYTLVN